jgi:hypothetical protein
MIFTCTVCSVSLADDPGRIPLLGETEDAKRTRYLEVAAAHMAHMHPEIMHQVVALSGLMGFATLMARITTDDADLLERRRFACQQIGAMVMPPDPPVHPAQKNPRVERSIA